MARRRRSGQRSGLRAELRAFAELLVDFEAAWAGDGPPTARGLEQLARLAALDAGEPLEVSAAEAWAHLPPEQRPPYDEARQLYLDDGRRFELAGDDTLRPLSSNAARSPTRAGAVTPPAPSRVVARPSGAGGSAARRAADGPGTRSAPGRHAVTAPSAAPGATSDGPARPGPS